MGYFKIRITLIVFFNKIKKNLNKYCNFNIFIIAIMVAVFLLGITARQEIQLPAIEHSDGHEITYWTKFFLTLGILKEEEFFIHWWFVLVLYLAIR